MKTVAILQSNYIPWKGYFDIIGSVDLFIFYDDIQYTKNDWRNRNKIKTDRGLEWLSIPCGTNLKRLICEVSLNDSKWQIDHWNKIKANYCKAKYFSEYSSFFEEFYLATQWKNLSEFNQSLIKAISQKILKFKTVFDDSRNYTIEGKKGDRLKELIIKTGADTYLSGPSAKRYFGIEDLIDTGINLKWMDYSDYPEYPQMHTPFEHNVSILDLIFNTGPDISKYMKS